MRLQGQQGLCADHGYAMAALLIGMSVAAVLMTAVMPVWKQATRRERESELIFRGQQYVRAIGLFQKKSGPGVLPPNLDVLISGRFLRKKFKDPITNQDFDLLSPTNAAGTAAPGQTPPGASPAQQPVGGRGGVQTSGAVVGGQPAGGAQAAGIPVQAGRGGATGGIIGVVSKSKDASIRLYNGRTHYNEWQFIFVQQAQAGGAGAGQPGGVPGQPGAAGRGSAPQRGGPPATGPGTQGSGRPGPGRGFGNPPVFPQGGRGSQPSAPTGTQPAGTQPASPFQPRR